MSSSGERSSGFAPLANADARILVLGSLPSQRSIAAQQYYAHPQNGFWRIMAALVGAEGRYADRCVALQKAGIALWDVLASSVRPGSLDADIQMSTAVVNDFAAFLAAHESIERICFNGQKAAKIFSARVPQDLVRDRVELLTLPSTSSGTCCNVFRAKARALERRYYINEQRNLAMYGVEIFRPFFAMMLLTLVVWVVMYVRRLRYIVAHRIDSQDLTIPEKGAKLIPENVNWPAYNLRNLFELPVLFYALCLYLYVTNGGDRIFVMAAWLFVLLRCAHSLVHCTRNIVKLRFIAYMLGAFVLWGMIARAAWQTVHQLVQGHFAAPLLSDQVCTKRSPRIP